MFQKFLGCDFKSLDLSKSKPGSRKKGDSEIKLKRDLYEKWVTERIVDICGSTIKENAPFFGKVFNKKYNKIKK